MTCPPRTPVLVGCAQSTQASEDDTGLLDATAIEPLEMMRRVALRAADDAGAPGLLAKIDSIRIPHGVWRYSNPAHQLGERLGCTGFETGLAPISGTSVQIMLSRAAVEIREGQRDVVLLASAECGHWTRRAKRLSPPASLPDWAAFGGFDPQEGGNGIPAPDRRFGAEGVEIGWWEKKYRVQAVEAFAMYENEMRFRRGEAMLEHRKRIAALWARFAAIAADNENAWIRSAPSAEVIGAESPDNRMVSYPYTKLMVANIAVNQAAAVLLCSYEAALRAGVPEDRLVFPHASAEATRTHEISQRPDLHQLPEMRLVADSVFERVGCDRDSIEHVDLYSCFPAAVQLGAAEFGLPADRDLTLTGGLTFSGGPLNSYVMHSTAAMMDKLRERRRAGCAERAIVSSIGGFIAKHAVAIYAAEPPPAPGFSHASVDDATSALPSRECRREYSGPAMVESFAVMPATRQSPQHLLLSCGVDGGARVWAECHDAGVLAAIETQDACGRDVAIGSDGEARFR